MAISLPRLGSINSVLEALSADERRFVDITGPWASGRSVLALQSALALNASLVVVAPGRADAESVYEDLSSFADEKRCGLFPAWEVLPTDIMSPTDDIVAERMDTLKRLADARAHAEPMYVAVSARALLQCVVQPETLSGRSLSFSVGDELDLEDLIAKLSNMGYRRELMVEHRGEMSVRGGIFDIFPISSELPIRVEFFGDEVESMRRFEPETQRSVDRIETIHVLPPSEKSLLGVSGQNQQSLALLTDYFPENTLVIISEPLALREEVEKLARQFEPNPYCVEWSAVLERLTHFPRLAVAQLPHDPLENDAKTLSIPMGGIAGWTGRLGGFWEQLHTWNNDQYRVVLICHNSGERRRLLELLEEQGFAPGQGDFDLRVEIGRLAGGFTSETDRLAVLSEREIFGRHYVRRARRRFEAGAGVVSFSDLRSGDYIVHAVHGIGRYEGLRRFPGKPDDFLAVRYAGGDMLYVPAAQIDQVQKYVGADGAVPKVDRLGGSTWARTRKRVKKAIRDMTDELVKLYASREAIEGYAFGPDTPWQGEFEDSFEYEETPDQARAIVDVKADMESVRPMDRLLCGDVGFGKTEVALRAAFKAVMDGRQAAILVPTTVLAQQHFATFTERLADYPVKVELLCRFRSPREQKATVERIKSGEVDIIIGTHRLISKDMDFKNLGLVIIDEEQHFGVAQKERLKQLRNNVDVLTMTATPIPRTLHLSLMGARDLSVINTAPNDRLPIHTCVAAFDENLIREAIQREIARDGQVFFLHNRVQTILSMAQLIHRLVPDARVGVAHGQMPEHHLEDVMAAFVRREIDVLVCTTIIGSGLDIPNANTIIVNRADHFGLAELYQLRGRVGRYKHRAFAYLLIPGDRVPTEDAEKRLKALEEFSELGAGYRIAMRDLEIRGCGNILGAEQHGHIAAVGYETYVDLIQEAVAEIRGTPIARRVLPPFEVAVEAHIPEEYVPSETQKITLYKRIAGILTVEAAREMQDELADRFGRPPAPVVRLLDVMRLRAMAVDAGIRAMTATRDKVTIEFLGAQLFGRKMRNVLKERYGESISFSWEQHPSVSLVIARDADVLKVTERLLADLLEIS